MSDPDTALEAAAEAKASYRDDPNEDTKAAHHDAAAELRYQRWLSRGGPGQDPVKSTEALHERWRRENAEV